MKGLKTLYTLCETTRQHTASESSLIVATELQFSGAKSIQTRFSTILMYFTYYLVLTEFTVIPCHPYKTDRQRLPDQMDTQELQQKALTAHSELQSVKAQINALQRSIQLGKVTKQEIEEIGGNGQVWQGVGKMFMSTKSTDYTSSLDTKSGAAEEKIEGLKKKEAYFATTLENLTKALTNVST